MNEPDPLRIVALLCSAYIHGQGSTAVDVKSTANQFLDWLNKK